MFLLYSFKKILYTKKKNMRNQLLIIFMSAFGVALALNPATNGINPGLLKGAGWAFRGIIFRLLK